MAALSNKNNTKKSASVSSTPVNLFEKIKKPVARLLITTLLFLDFPVLPISQSVHAADVDPSKWVNVLTQPDPILENLIISNNASTKGMWSSTTYSWPMVAVHATLLPNGKVLSYGTNAFGGFDGRTFDVWDPKLGFANNSHTTTSGGYQDSFCSTATFLTNGKLLISGGNSAPGGRSETGVSVTSNIYSPDTNTITKATSNLALDRWYATMITLPNGNPIMLGGMQAFREGMADTPEAAIAQGWASMTPEVYENSVWRSLFGANSRVAFGPDYNRTSYPRAWVAQNGKVFGISADKMWYLDASGNGGLTDAGTFKGPYSATNPINVGATNTAVMFDIGKILVAGGNGRTWSDGLPASNMATIVDINNETPVLTEQNRMNFPRRMANSLVLATGDVVVTGGSKLGNNSGTDAVYAAEIWSPSTGQWTLGAEESTFRGYHAQSTLLPNGTILSYGGGWPDAAPGLRAQVYFPPYLFKNDGNNTSVLAERPIIKALSGLSYVANDAIQLDMSAEDTISQLVLIGVSNGTHAFNSGQRRIPLTFTQQSFRLTASIPNYNLTPPGYYQIVAVNENGVPSLGAIIGIGQGLTAPLVPTTPYVPPNLSQTLSLPIINPGETASYTINPVNGLTYSWNFGDGSTDTPFDANPSVIKTYNQPGLYIVTLSARNTDGIISTRTFLQAVATSITTNSPTFSTPILVESRAGSGARVWVVNPDNDSVSIIDAETNVRVSSIDVGKSPRSIAIAPDGRIWVTNKESATISIISPATLSVTQTITLKRASQPHGIAFSPNQNFAFVILEGTGELLKLNSVTTNLVASLSVGPNPRHLSVNHDTSVVLVSRFISPPLPGESTANIATTINGENVGGEVLAINPDSMAMTKTIVLQHSDKPDTQIQGSGLPNYLSAAVISPDGSTAWIPSKQDNIKRGQLRNGLALNFQNTVRAISSNLRLSTLSEDYTKRVDHDNSSLASAAVYHPSGVYVFVALETSRQVAVVDAIAGFELFKFDVGRAPQGLAISADGNTLYVQDFMDRSVSIINLQPLVKNGELKVTPTDVVFSVDISQEKLQPQVLLGKQFFYDAKDARLARDSYMSCASCHNDSGHDGRVWDLTGFGEGLRNTIALKGRAGMAHGFLHWSANFDEVQDFEKQIRDLAGGLGLMTDAQYNTGTRNQALGDRKSGVSSDLDMLAAYLTSLNSFDETPYRTDSGTLTIGAELGKQVFESNNCMSCHASSKLTNSLNASTLSQIGTVKTSSGKRLNDTLPGIDVPTLVDVWKTAPYLHDGSASSISAAISAHNNLSISSTDLQNLVSYLEQIGSDSVHLLPNVVPQISLVSPLANASYVQGTPISLSANAADSDGAITKIEFYDGTSLLSTSTTAPYAYTLNNASVGNHSLTAIAFDNANAQTTSAAINVTVTAPVTPPVTTTVLLSRSKVATQSSTRTFNGITALPGFAVDGNTNGSFFSQSLSHTDFQGQPWWQVDLATSASISQIKLWNRTDCCANRLVNFYVFIANTDMTGRTLPQLIADASITKQLVTSFNGANNLTLNFPNPQGRYVRVQLNDTNSLELAEVEVYGVTN